MMLIMLGRISVVGTGRDEIMEVLVELGGG